MSAEPTETWGSDRREADAHKVLELVRLRAAVESTRDAVLSGIVVFILYQEGLRYWAWGALVLAIVIGAMRAVSPAEDSYILGRLKRVLEQI